MQLRAPYDTTRCQTQSFEQLLAKRLYPVAYLEHQDMEVVLVDEAGLVYLLESCDRLKVIASVFENSLEHLMRRIASPMNAQEDLRRLGLHNTRWHLPPNKQLD